HSQRRVPRQQAEADGEVGPVDVGENLVGISDVNRVGELLRVACECAGQLVIAAGSEFGEQIPQLEEEFQERGLARVVHPQEGGKAGPDLDGRGAGLGEAAVVLDRQLELHEPSANLWLSGTVGLNVCLSYADTLCLPRRLGEPGRLPLAPLAASW